jgi:hypothetical protein
MIDDKTKYKLLKELEKSGNVFLSCLRVGVDRSTYYRWFDADKEFRKLAGQAVRRGRENNCDIAKHALMIKVKEKDMGAIKYVLSNNDPAYRRKQTSNVVIVHKKIDSLPLAQAKSLEQIIEEDERSLYDLGLELQKDLTSWGRTIPPKPNGSPIKIDELPGYEAYIRDWQKLVEQEIARERFNKGLPPTGIAPYHPNDAQVIERMLATGTVDSASEKDKPPEVPPENQTSSDSSGSSSAIPDKKPDNNT